MFSTAILSAGLLCLGLAVAGMLATAYEFQKLEKQPV